MYYIFIQGVQMEIKVILLKDRKQHVIEKAHQLFIDKGFQATSIQDILEFSGISKGTFYNYFSSKNELLIAIFKTIFKKMDIERNKLLIGQDPADIEIFIKQMELQMKSNKKNKLFALFEEVFFSNDKEMKEFLKRGQMMMLRWVYQRFIDLFGEAKKPYLLDCAIMFMGMVQLNLHFDFLANGEHTKIHRVVKFSVNRIVKMIDEVAESGEQLLNPELLETWFPNCQKSDHLFKEELIHTTNEIKKTINKEVQVQEAQVKYYELLDFVLDELLQSREPRKFIIESALLTLTTELDFINKVDLSQLNDLVTSFFSEPEIITQKT